MEIEFSGKIWTWRGPAPYYFVTVPAKHSETIKAVASLVTYGWGMIPADVTIGETRWYTALWPKDGLYIVPLKDRIRKAEGLEEGHEVMVRLEIKLWELAWQRTRPR